MAEAGAFAALDPCVHCGFCLPACPTYLATGDEADSPRGRIVLMRALERGEIAADDVALLQHLDSCLGCRGCEPVCPSGVGYGRGLEAARTSWREQRGPAARRRGRSSPSSVIAGSGGHSSSRRAGSARPGIPARLAGGSALGFNFGMLAASAPSGRPAPD